MKKNRLINILWVAAVGGIFLISSSIGLKKQEQEESRLYRMTLREADVNSDNMVDHQEWNNVYKSLEMRYDVNSNPRKDLSLKDMRQYVN